MVFDIWNYKCHDIYVFTLIAPGFWAYAFTANVWKNSGNFLYKFLLKNAEFEHVWAAARVPPTSTGWKLKSRGSLRFEDNDIMGFLLQMAENVEPTF